MELHGITDVASSTMESYLRRMFDANTVADSDAPLRMDRNRNGTMRSDFLTGGESGEDFCAQVLDLPIDPSNATKTGRSRNKGVRSWCPGRPCLPNKRHRQPSSVHSASHRRGGGLARSQESRLPAERLSRRAMTGLLDLTLRNLELGLDEMDLLGLNGLAQYVTLMAVPPWQWCTGRHIGTRWTSVWCWARLVQLHLPWKNSTCFITS